MAILLDFMAKVGVASPDDAMEDIVKMADPGNFDTKVDLQDHFEKTLGYDPVTYFSKKYLEEKLRELEDIAPFSVREKLVSKKDTIILQSLECLSDLDMSILNKVLSSVVEYNTGWNSGINDGVSVENCISLSLYGETYQDDDEDSDPLDDGSELSDEDEGEDLDEVNFSFGDEEPY